MTIHKRVLVTGSSGFVGTHVVAVLDRAGIEVLGIDLDEPQPGSEPRCFRQCDVRDSERLERLIRHEQPDAIVHAATITDTGDPQRARDVVLVNQLSTLTVLTAGAEAGCRRVIFMSSAGVYSDPLDGALLDESSPVANTGGLYAQTKLASERLCAWASRELGLTTFALRVGPVYGEWERTTGSRSRMSPVFRAVELAVAGEPIRCNAPETIYNFIHGDDVGHAVLSALAAESPSSVFNLGGAPVTTGEMLDVVADVVPGSGWSHVEDADGCNLVIPGVSRPLATNRIREELGFSETVDLRTGIHRTAARFIAGRNEA